MNNEKYLPIGSVCLLKDATKKIMITGFVAKSGENNQIFDYVGCVYPEGIISSDKNLLFNHDQIAEVFHVGYSNEEELEFKTKLNTYISQIDSSEIPESL